jgi:hypothetical protein
MPYSSPSKQTDFFPFLLDSLKDEVQIQLEALPPMSPIQPQFSVKPSGTLTHSSFFY